MDANNTITIKAAQLLKDQYNMLKFNSNLTIGLKLLAKGHGFVQSKPLCFTIENLYNAAELLDIKFNYQKLLLLENDMVTDLMNFTTKAGETSELYNKTTVTKFY